MRPALVIGVCLAALSVARAPGQDAPWRFPCPPDRDPALWSILDEHVEASVREFPTWVGPSLNDDRYNDRLEDVSPEAVERRLREAKARLARLRALDISGFSEADYLDMELIVHELELAIDGARFHEEQMPVASVRGPQYWLPQLASFVPFSRPRHYADYVSRLEQIPTLIDQYITQMRAGMDAGRVPPKVVVAPAVAQARSQADESFIDRPTTSPFYEPFASGKHPELGERAASIIAEEITPAYERLAAFLEDEYLPACRDTVGISEGVDGEAAYDFALRTHTTLDLTARDVHEIGLAEVARITREMHEVISRTDWQGNGRSWSSEEDRFEAFVEFLRTESRFYHDDPEDLLAGYRNISKLIDAELPKLFTRLPRLPYGVREIPRFAAPSSPSAYYYEGSLDGGKSGFFMANTYRLDQRPIYEMTALTLHEAVPGHHLQISLAQEMEGVHAFRRMSGYTAFVEGWALYAERLGLEVGGGAFGLYTDPYQDFGRLNFEMWRAMRLVVDTGMHAEGWTRDQAIEYMTANSAISEHNIRAEVDRYIGWPGQACGYMLGRLAILEMRTAAEEALGESFDLRAFHDHLLGAGALPLPVLERRMQRWVASQQD